MGRGLSRQQRAILAALKGPRAIPIRDLVEIYWEGDADDAVYERREKAGDLDGYFRDREHACRRAVAALERRGLVEVVWVDVKWRRRLKDRSRPERERPGESEKVEQRLGVRLRRLAGVHTS